MEVKITKNPQPIVIYKVQAPHHSPNHTIHESELHGKTMIGNFYICNNSLIVKDNDGIVLGVFSLDHYYFIKPNFKHNPEF